MAASARQTYPAAHVWRRPGGIIGARRMVRSAGWKNDILMTSRDGARVVCIGSPRTDSIVVAHAIEVPTPLPAEGTFFALVSYPNMPNPMPDDTQARRIALAKRREEQAADAPKAMAEYKAKQRAALTRMHELRAMRLAREAAAASKEQARH
jgi:hypothetical protein